MRNSRTNQDQKATKAPHVNIAGDFSANRIDVAPDAMSAQDFETESDELGEMQNIAPKQNDQGGVKKQMAENKHATARIANPSSNNNVNTDWPVDE